jgi:hypothetical protein
VLLAEGLTPSVEGGPSVSRSWATEIFPKSGRLSNAVSDISRTSPTVFRPAANKAFLIRVGNWTSRIGVLSGSCGVVSSSLISGASFSGNRRMASADSFSQQPANRSPSVKRSSAQNQITKLPRATKSQGTVPRLIDLTYRESEPE